MACGIVAEMGWVGGEGGEEDGFGAGGGAGEEESEAIILREERESGVGDGQGG